MFSLARITVLTSVIVCVIVIAGWFHLGRPGTAPNAYTPPPRQEQLSPPVASMRYLPAEVQLALVSLCGGCTFADSNGAWNPTDVIDDRLPRRRLTRTEKRGTEWFIKYEHGGIFTGRYTVVLSATSEPKLLQGSSCVPTPAQVCKW